MKKVISVTNARRQWGRVLDRLALGHEVVITRGGEPAARLIPTEEARRKRMERARKRAEQARRRRKPSGAKARRATRKSRA